MPYASDKQRRFFHTATARRKGITASTVAHYDSASRGTQMPERVSDAVKGLKRAASLPARRR